VEEQSCWLSVLGISPLNVLKQKVFMDLSRENFLHLYFILFYFILFYFILYLLRDIMVEG